MPFSKSLQEMIRSLVPAGSISFFTFFASTLNISINPPSLITELDLIVK
jgi:hypothetical protein